MKQYTQEQKVLLAIAGFFMLFVIVNFFYHKVVVIHSLPSRTEMQCDLKDGPCTVQIAKKGGVTLTVLPMGIPAGQTLTFEVSLSGDLTADNVQLGVLNIHIPNCNVQLTMNKSSATKFLAETKLPICNNPTQNWLALIKINRNTNNTIVPYHFSTPTNSGRN